MNFTKRKKTIEIQIVGDRRIRILAPRRTSEKDISELMRRKEQWLEKKFSEFRTRKSLIQERNYSTGAEFPLLGKQLPLVFDSMLSPNPTEPCYEDICTMQEIRLHHQIERTADCVWSVLVQQYLQYANIYLTTRTKEIAASINVRANNIKVREYKSRWGSCSSQAKISYNWKIIMAPVEIIDYLIIHELCHILEHNHSQKFWEHVRRFDPEFAEHRVWLKNYGETLQI